MKFYISLRNAIVHDALSYEVFLFIPGLLLKVKFLDTRKFEDYTISTKSYF